MRTTRFLIPAVVLLTSVTAAGAQTNRSDEWRDAMERTAAQDGYLSEQEIRLRADELIGRDESDQIVTSSVRRPPTTSGSAERNAAMRTPDRSIFE